MDGYLSPKRRVKKLEFERGKYVKPISPLLVGV